MKNLGNYREGLPEVEVDIVVMKTSERIKSHEYFLLASVDLILKDAESFEKERKVVNMISNEVYLESIEV